MYKIVVETPKGWGGGGVILVVKKRKFREGGGGDLREIPSVVGHGYFLELHNEHQKC